LEQTVTQLKQIMLSDLKKGSDFLQDKTKSKSKSKVNGK